MQTFLSCVCAAVAVLCCVSCGSKSPTAAGDSSVPLVARDGRTGTPVAAAITPVGSGMEISATGFLTVHPVRHGGDVFLWPNDAALPVSYTRALVYRDQDPGQSIRWADGVHLIGLQPEGVFRSGRPLQALQEAAVLASAAHPVLEFVVGGGDRSIPVDLGPSDPVFQQFPNAGGFAEMFHEGGRFSRGRIVMKRIPEDPNWEDGWVYLRIALAHEMIHASGLMGHVPAGAPGLMGATASIYSYRDFTDDERFTMTMQYRRVPGTGLTGTREDETGVFAQSVGGRSVIVLD